MSTPPAHHHAARRDTVRQQLSDHGVDRLLVTDPANVRYLTGFTGSNGQVLIAADPVDDRLVTDARYRERAASEVAAGLGTPIDVVLGDPSRYALEGPGGVTLGAEADHLSWSFAERLRERAARRSTKLRPVRGVVEAARLVKDDTELDRLARACALTIAAMTWLFEEVVGIGRTERELATALERRFVDLGADGVAFDAIVASGPNTAVPHHAPTARQLRCGDLLTVDCGALVDGYHADCTRTIAVGRPSSRLAEVHELVREAQAAGRSAVVPGATGGAVDEASRAVIRDAGHADGFVHGTGHGVGLAIHEAPAVAHNAADTLRPQSSLTVEPGVYLPGIGGVRIEDTLVVAPSGAARCLTDTPRHLIVV